ncbi:ABC transporter ATP-binding protein [Citricoccus muralis]|uniref:ABC transporter ATP-binding protein n=1 Tax=Citricoccus muralis TaxID=169134 RepID=A0ABY8H491_9MICC|nr:ABC transporter ATP-binding protein [Citricoccus muralis]WFP15761.1 ABC transporter ATP-binding protein [Citricoccus muralis]
MDTTTAISIQDVHRRFGSVTAVNGITLTVTTGEVLALLGPNGAGKTTLLDMVLGFTTPSSGTISVYGRAPEAAARDGQVGAVLQNGGLLDDLTVAETIRMVAACHVRHLPVAEVMQRAGVASFATRKVKKCSGGQQQRLRFALALLTDPQLLILDEPTAGMDAGARREFWQTMHAEAERGRTIIFATHYLREADDYADRVVLVQGGRVVADGTVSEMTTGFHRILSAEWIGDDDPRVWAAQAGLSEEQFTVEAERSRIQITSPDTDALAAELLASARIRHLQIVHPGIEDVFFELTTQEVPA